MSEQAERQSQHPGNHYFEMQTGMVQETHRDDDGWNTQTGIKMQMPCGFLYLQCESCSRSRGRKDPRPGRSRCQRWESLCLQSRCWLVNLFRLFDHFQTVSDNIFKKFSTILTCHKSRQRPCPCQQLLLACRPCCP